MAVEYFEMGEAVPLSVLQNPRAKAFAEAVKKNPFAELIRAVKDGTDEGIETEIKPEVPTYPVNDIKKSERICVVFSSDENKQPNVLALRKDFPSNLQHLNLTELGKPKNLCLFGQEYREIKRWLSPEQFLLRIFDWLNRAAIDKQHLPDQPLEPFLITPIRVICEPEIFTRDNVDEVIIVGLLDDSDRPIYKAWHIPLKNAISKLKIGKNFIALPIVTAPYHARTIKQTPLSVEDLSVLLESINFNLVDKLREKTREIYLKTEKLGTEKKIMLEQKWALLVRLPKTRAQEGPIESLEDWVFLLNDTIGELGRKLGKLELQDGTWAYLIQELDVRDLDKSTLLPASSIQALDRIKAKNLSGMDNDVPKRITVVGAGAIGSHVIMNLARQGIGMWTVIDEDNLLPHNHTRYALSPRFEGHKKAEVIAEEIKILLNDEEAAKAIAKDMLSITPESEEMKGVVEETDLILDFSVSPSVSRHIALLGGTVQRICIFLLRDGQESILISEGKQRKIRLDDLEVQFYVACAENKKLGDLFGSDITPIRYSGACRDVTTVLSEDYVCMHAGIASQFIRKHWANESACIAIWRLNEKTGEVSRFNVEVKNVVDISANGWEVRISQRAINLMRKYRHTKLPNETGGVLLGEIDLCSKIIYVGTVLPSPPDSQEWPFTYIRGCRGLEKTIRDMAGKCGGNIQYVGEWHSHPGGYSSKPSKDDLDALDWLQDHMSEDGYPALLMIQGEENVPTVMIKAD